MIKYSSLADPIRHEEVVLFIHGFTEVTTAFRKFVAGSGISAIAMVLLNHFEIIWILQRFTIRIISILLL